MIARSYHLAGTCVVMAFFLSVSNLPALDWKPGPGYRSAPLTVAAEGRPGFTPMDPAQTGVHFTNQLALNRHLANQILLNGSGVAAGDVDGDGWCDLYFCSLDGNNVLYRNLGAWSFQDITQEAGVAAEGLDATGAALFDFEGDGDLDLVINSCGGGTHIFLNDGKAHFQRATPSAGLNPGRGGMSLAVADIDGDGYLDFYITNYRPSALMDMPDTHFATKTLDGQQVITRVNGRSVTEPDLAGRFRISASGRVEENGEADVFYRNLAGTNVFSLTFTDGSFLDEEGRPLSETPLDWGLSAMFRDINRDGLPDLYICNDFNSPDQFWINQGQLRFRALPRLSLRKTSHFSMGIDFADLNRDGLDDFFVLDMLSREHGLRMDMLGDRDPSLAAIAAVEGRPQYLMNTLFLNRGANRFSEIAQLSGVAASEWSWATIFLDVDLDGWEDLLISNGHERAGRSMDVADKLKALRTEKKMSPAEIIAARQIYPRQSAVNLAFRNRHDLSFEETSQAWGFTAPTVSHGMAVADLDNDGDLDLMVNNLNDAAGLFRNDSIAPRLAIRLAGRKPNTRGIGARITVRGGPVEQSQEMICAGRYLSCDESIRTFAAGSATNTLSIEVRWPSGQVSLLSTAQPNRVYVILESGAKPAPATVVPPPNPAFEDVSATINHRHEETAFDDFALQPLLPKRFSQLGPGVAWFDWDADGWDDLFIGSGSGGQLAAYRNNEGKGFTRLTGPPWSQSVTRDQTGLVGWRKANGEASLLAGSANYEDGLTNGSAVRQYDLKANKVLDRLPGQLSSTGPIALGDVDGDQDLDLFVGGRVVPGRYAEPATSMIFRDEGGEWKPDAANNGRLQKVGLVSGAVWSDVDGDGDVDLVLACEWGPVRVFRNDKGLLSDASRELGLEEYRGWWNGVTTGDFDGDGRMDIVASNWGRNTKYESFRERALQLFYGDFDDNGSIDVIEGHFDSGLRKIVPEAQLDFLATALPFLREQFPTRELYGRAGVQDLLKTRMGTAQRLHANWLESTVFLNRGAKFAALPLPIEAQMAPCFGMAVADGDGDGTEDIFLTQNFFDPQPDTPRYDAGFGLWLRGNGRGEFQAATVVESGIEIYGQQRGCAVADFDRDGRVDWVVTQNNAATKLFRNLKAKPGLSIELRGPPRNSAAAGAMIRLGDDQGWGPAREIHLGAGYWSQDSAKAVMAHQRPERLWIRWPGGTVQTIKLPRDARTVQLDFNGNSPVVK